MLEQRMPLNVNDLLYPLCTASESMDSAAKRSADFPRTDEDIAAIEAEIRTASEAIARATALVEQKQTKESVLESKHSKLRLLAKRSKPMVTSMFTTSDVETQATNELIADNLITQTPVKDDDRRFEYAITDAGRAAHADLDVLRRAAYEAQKAFRRVDA